MNPFSRLATRIRFTRRRFLAACAVLGATLGLPGCGDQPSKTPVKKGDDDASISKFIILTDSDRALLQAVAETIIPKDEDPGAEILDIPALIEAYLQSNPGMVSFFRSGQQAVDAAATAMYAQAKNGFVDLNQGQREFFFRAFFDHTEDPKYVATHDSTSMIYKFLLAVYNHTRNAYYVTPEAYAMLGYTPPIEGYPDYARAPGDD